MEKARAEPKAEKSEKPKRRFKEMTGAEYMRYVDQASGGKF